jgi:hypothetical protein
MIMRYILISFLILVSCSQSKPDVSIAKQKQPLCDQGTAQVFESMKPKCAGCHTTGARPMFASLSAFESLIVRDVRMVKPGDPNQSELIKLLRGTSTGSFTRMPIAGPTWSELFAANQVTLSLVQIENWVTQLTLANNTAKSNSLLTGNTRLSAQQLTNALYSSLGLAPADICTSGSVTCQEDLLPIVNPDDWPRTDVWSNSTQRYDRHGVLGGGSLTENFTPGSSVATTFALNFQQVAQTWCRVAILKNTNAVLIPQPLTLASAAQATNAKSLISFWFKHFHSRVASAPEVDEVFDEVFVKRSQTAGSDTTSAWVSTCSFFVRHPDFITR